MTTAKLFQNGQSQAVRLPKAFRLPGTEVYIKKVGNAIVLLPMDQPWGYPLKAGHHTLSTT
jgi:antitoxin VapB